MKMKLRNSGLLMIGLMLFSCVTPKSAPPTNPNLPVYGTEIEEFEEGKTLWLTDKVSGKRVHLLADGAQYYSPEFTPDQTYLIVTRKSMSHTQGVIVFKRSDSGYRQLNLKPSIDAAWEKFNAEHDFVLDIKYAERIEGYDSETQSLELIIGVFGKLTEETEVDWIEKAYPVSLAGLSE